MISARTSITILFRIIPVPSLKGFDLKIGLMISEVIVAETDCIKPSSVEIPAEISPRTTISPI